MLASLSPSICRMQPSTMDQTGAKLRNGLHSLVGNWRGRRVERAATQPCLPVMAFGRSRNSRFRPPDRTDTSFGSKMDVILDRYLDGFVFVSSGHERVLFLLECDLFWSWLSSGNISIYIRVLTHVAIHVDWRDVGSQTCQTRFLQL